MRFPQETVVRDFLPTYRALLARALTKEGLSQDAIADHIGVTQAQISKYLSEKTDLNAKIKNDPRVQRLVQGLAPRLAEGRIDDVTALAESQQLIRTLQNRGPLCEIHTEAMPSLEGTGCDACIEPDSDVLAEHQVLVDLRYALRRLLHLDTLPNWIPHVGSNLAQARSDPQGLWDVAALPGRIDAIGGQARASTQPSFGASRHVATIVLAVMQLESDTRAAMNLAYRPELLDRVDALGLQHADFDASYDGREAEVTRRLEEHQDEKGKLPEVLYHEGAFGIEPVAYVLGTDAPSVVDRIARLLADAPRAGGKR